MEFTAVSPLKLELGQHIIMSKGNESFLCQVAAIAEEPTPSGWKVTISVTALKSDELQSAVRI